MRLAFITVLLLAGGCASFEYDLVQPADLAQRVGSKAEVTFSRDTLDYRLVTLDSRLVLRAYNRTEQPMTLNGERSVVVDEDGQSHPLRGLTIAPGSFAKLILPPLGPRIERVGPSIGIGFGAAYGDARRLGYYDWNHYPAEPRYFTVYDDGAYDWDWTKESDVRLTLVFEQGQTTIRHEFVFRRRKV